MSNFVQDQGRQPNFKSGLTTGIHVVFRELKFEPAVPPLAGDKRGRFEIGSDNIAVNYQLNYSTTQPFDEV